MRAQINAGSSPEKLRSPLAGLSGKWINIGTLASDFKPRGAGRKGGKSTRSRADEDSKDKTSSRDIAQARRQLSTLVVGRVLQTDEGHSVPSGNLPDSKSARASWKRNYQRRTNAAEVFRLTSLRLRPSNFHRVGGTAHSSPSLSSSRGLGQRLASGVR